MKVKRNKRTREERAKLRKSIPALKKLKIKKCAVRKNKDIHKSTIIIGNDMNTDDGQNISQLGEHPTKKTTMPSSFKRRKKQSCSKETVSESSDLQHNMTDSAEWGVCKDGKTDDDWKVSNSKDETKEDDDWTQIVPKGQRNLGSPLVIEVLSDSVTSLNLLQTLEHEHKTRSDKETFYDVDTFGPDILPNEKDTCVVIAESINPKPKHNTPGQTKPEQQASSALPSTDESNRNTDKRMEDANVYNRSSPNRSTGSRKYIKDKNRKSYTNRNNNAEVHGSPSQVFEDISSASQSTRNKKKPKVYCIRNIVVVIMESGSRFCFTGKLSVKVLYGAVKIYGFVLNSSTQATKVYSPRGYSSVVVETSEAPSEDSVDGIWTALASAGITRDSESKLLADIDNVRPGVAVLALQSFENNLTLFLKTYFPFRLFPRITNPCYYPWTDPRRAEIVLQANLNFEQHDGINCKRLIVDPCITVDIAEMMLNRWRANERSCAMIVGGKSVGKSTSVRCLVNSLLRATGKVVLLDVDPGQAECTPASCISYSLIEEPLMGPNFTHLKTPVYQLFLDEVNVARCVTRYLEGVKMLVERLNSCPVLSRLPVVVNTMGFVRHLGWDIMMFTIKLIRPTIISQIVSSKKQNNYADVLSAAVVNKQVCTWTFCDERFLDWSRPCEYDLCVIQSRAESFAAQKNEWSMEPYQQRELVLMSYLSDITRDNNDPFNNTRLSVTINEATPYTAPFSSLCVIPKRLFGVPASRVLSVINGNIVALCGIDLTEESLQESEAISSLRVLTHRSSLCTCYGFGIIRGVDMERQEVFINTPVPISIMQHVNCLAGCIPVPPVLLQLHQRAPYVGGNAGLPTSRETRRRGTNYFRMRHQRMSNKS